MSSKKLAVVSHVFPPYPSGQSMMLSRMMRSLDPSQYELILTRDYAGYDQNTAIEPLPKSVHQIEPPGEDSIEQMSIMKLLLPIAQGESKNPFLAFYGKLRNRLKLALARRYTVQYRAKAIERIVKETNCDGIMACTGDLYDLPSAYQASQACDVPFFPYLLDDYHYQYVGYDQKIARRFEPVFMKSATASIVTNSFVQRTYQERHGVETTVMHNAAELPNLEQLDQCERVLDTSTINIVYTGAVYHAHYDAFQNLVTALNILNRQDIKLHIFSSQPPELLAEYGIKGDFVIHHGHVPHEQIALVQRQADLLFLPLAFHSDIDVVLRNASPGKLGEYLGVARPILVHTRHDYFHL